MRRIRHSSITYFFVMDGPNFETPAMLLSQSLRDAVGDDAHIIAYVPNEKIADVHGVTRRAFALLDVEIRGFDTQPSPWASGYPHGNKILAACAPRDTDLSVFLDTDIVCLRAPDFSAITEETSLFAAPEGVRTWGKDQTDWSPVYELFGLDLPDWRVKLTKGRRLTVLPYFNAGVVGFLEQGTAMGQRLPEIWLDTAVKIDANTEVPDKRPWLDQIALPVAAARMEGSVAVLTKAHNFSPFRTPDDVDLSDVQFLHYHTPAYFRKYQICYDVAWNLLARAPAPLRQKLRRRLGVFGRGLDFSEHKFADGHKDAPQTPEGTVASDEL